VAFQRGGAWEEFYLSVQSAVEDVLAACGIPSVVIREPVGKPQALWQSPENYVEVCSGKKSLGTLGILEKDLTAKICREGGQIVWFELELDKISGDDVVSTLYPEVSFEEPPRYPLSWQDFSLLWKIEDGFGKLESILDRFNNPLVIRREFLVSYRGKGLDKGTACYSFRFWIGSQEHTLSGEEIESFHQQFLAFIMKNDISLRT
jgi:phenylalanyl-tRNA synthetase beta subunit